MIGDLKKNGLSLTEGSIIMGVGASIGGPTAAAALLPMAASLPMAGSIAGGSLVLGELKKLKI